MTIISQPILSFVRGRAFETINLKREKEKARLETIRE